MTTNKHVECYACDAVFKIRHDLDTHYYQILHCPFCGADMEEEESFDQDDEE